MIFHSQLAWKAYLTTTLTPERGIQGLWKRPCAPLRCALFHGNHQKWKMLRVTPTSQKRMPPPWAPWCTTQVGGAQCRSMVHNVALYCWSDPQFRFYLDTYSVCFTFLGVVSKLDRRGQGTLYRLLGKIFLMKHSLYARQYSVVIHFVKLVHAK